MNSPLHDPLEALRAVQAFAMFTLDGSRWLLPQTEVQALETLLDIDLEMRVPQSVGAITVASEWWSVYCLSGELHLLSQIPAGRRVCLLLNNGADCFGLACDHIEALVGTTLPLHPVPMCMVTPDSPIQALALFDQGLGCVTTTEHIARRIAMAGDRADV